MTRPLTKANRALNLALSASDLGSDHEAAQAARTAGRLYTSIDAAWTHLAAMRPATHHYCGVWCALIDAWHDAHPVVWTPTYLEAHDVEMILWDYSRIGYRPYPITARTVATILALRCTAA